MSIKTTTEAQTEAFAHSLASALSAGDIVLLSGPLGSGKTVLARALIRALCDTPDLDVPSPTFTLVQTYDSQRAQIRHFDLYRLEEPEELYELGWEDGFAGSITIIEWPERLGHMKPRAAIEIILETPAGLPEQRSISCTPDLQRLVARAKAGTA